MVPFLLLYINVQYMVDKYIIFQFHFTIQWKVVFWVNLEILEV